MKIFEQFIGEIKTKAKAVHSNKPRWNDNDYLNDYGNIDLSNKNLTGLPCVFPVDVEKRFLLW